MAMNQSVKPGDEFYCVSCKTCGLPVALFPAKNDLTFAGPGKLQAMCPNGHQHDYETREVQRFRAERLH